MKREKLPSMVKSNKNLFIWLLLFFALLPLKNIHAGILCRLNPDYSPNYIYVHMIIISIIIIYVIVMFIFSHIFIKNKKLLLKALLLFLILLFLFFLNIIFSAIPAIIATVVLSIVLVWILSYISVKNKVLFLKAFITLFTLLFILSVANFYGDKKVLELKDFNAFVECKKSGGVLRESVCGTGHKYCSFLTADYGKICYDDNDCEEFCAIENIEEIKRIWDSNYPDNYVPKEYGRHLDHYLDIEKSDWISKTGIKIEGKCSKFKGEARSNTCGGTFGEIWIENGVIKRNERCYSW